MFGLGFWFVDVVAIVFGGGLVVNCLIGLFSREGRWDRESASIMVWSQLAGIGLGLLMVAWGTGYLSIPLPGVGCIGGG